jgi:2-polyprenyl-6-methoxyphenol hydroxylase-like FAD-dependent oxidoreductase
LKKGNIDNTLHIFIKKKEIINLRIKELLAGETKYPYFLILEQNKTEGLLIESLEEYGAKVNWQHELTGFKEVDNGVEATIRFPSGKEETSEFRYLVGCDGADSTVRSKGSFSFKGKTFSSIFYLADSEIEGGLKHGDIYFMFAPGYITGVFSFQEKDKFRIFNFMNPSVEKSGELTSENVQEILDSNPYLKLQAKNIQWTSVFKIHVRNAGEFHKGRIFLAGDAAHVHSPAGGQGMNTGIQDAYNLAWKLSLVLKGKAGSRLFSTYHRERYPIAKNLHKTTDRLFNIMITKNKLAEFLRFYVIPSVFRVIFRMEFSRKKNIRRLSQLAIKYRNSPLNKDGSVNGFSPKGPKPGDRAPYCEIISRGKKTDIYSLFECDSFTILIAVPENKETGEILAWIKEEGLPVNAYVIDRTPGGNSFHEIYGVKKEAVFIIRPDSHIAFRSSRLDLKEIQDYFKGVLGMNPEKQ